MRDFHIYTAPRRDSKAWSAGKVTWDEIQAWVADPADQKECGNYVLGVLEGNRRTKASIVSRGVLALDADTAGRDFLLQASMELTEAFIAHTTYSSAPDDPHWRLLIPLNRDVTPDEYHKLATLVMDRIGTDRFDPGSVQAERYMFKPSTQNRNWYSSHVQPGEPLLVDEWLGDYEDDLSAIPLPKPSRFKRDPYAIEGTVGIFNRAYMDWDELIHVYELPYERSATADRWHLLQARSVAGMGVVSPGLVYSHHVNDPAYDQACSAFDLVRLHRFGELDEDCKPNTPVNRRPSHEAMLELAAKDPRVAQEQIGSDFDDEVGEGTASWQSQLVRNPRTAAVIDNVTNWDLIVANEPLFSNLVWDDLSNCIEVLDHLPWRKVDRLSRSWNESDQAQLNFHLERKLGLRAFRQVIEDRVLTQARENKRHPIRHYLETLPAWDGTPRVERCLPGAPDTKHNRMVARKVMTAAVARVLEPGCKWDHVLVLHGTEGMGKSWWINRMTLGHDTSLGDIRNKDTLLSAHRAWVVVADEGYSLRKAEADPLKEFLTRTSDMYRAPYARETRDHPRGFCIWSTTNDNTFLRQQEGNRRFLVVRCEQKVDFDAITPQYIQQVWAEALHLYRNGERLHLNPEESEMAAEHREFFLEEDAIEPLVRQYLDMRVPDTWHEMSPSDRQSWVETVGDFGDGGTERIDLVCSMQIWVEALGNHVGDHRRGDLLQITNVLKQLPGWEALPGTTRVAGYGPQRVFRRTSVDVLDEVL